LLGKLPDEKKAMLDPGSRDVVAQSMAITPEDYFEAVRQRGAWARRCGVHGAL
jgi:hypothetical protein